MERHFIYTITDPLTNGVVYVGRTISPHKRFYQHNRCTKTAIGKHIQYIKKMGERAIFTVIEDVGTTNTSVYNREDFWIKTYRVRGARLLNACCNKKRKDYGFDVVISQGITL